MDGRYLDSEGRIAAGRFKTEQEAQDAAEKTMRDLVENMLGPLAIQDANEKTC